eukprot:CAMPEP_0179107082 /NCGR_PEP_ID=MMETSP0796-20121207/49823_1 /TAXON_ID=73915 /ORGANISM="Pyrodinium bahamense, Strain pbaha01" /LENGTH=303 /DNA_ID=CAMNT_0020805135 /DNA_START=9 /DNA_END=920 /DNA_ORIENTATION=+
MGPAVAGPTRVGAQEPDGDLGRRRHELYRKLGISEAGAEADLETIGDWLDHGELGRKKSDEEAPDWEIVDLIAEGPTLATRPGRRPTARGGPRAQLLAPPRRPLHRQTVTIFDWDDTLLCTSFLLACRDGALPSSAARCFRGIASLGQCLLRRALQCGRTFIITNAVQGWVEHSAAMYAPELLPALAQVCVISARGGYEAQYPNEVGRWKVEAFLEVQRQLDSHLVTNLISLGDSDYEMDAVHAMGRGFARAVVKTVKFLEKPRPEALYTQLKLVTQKFRRIVEKPHNLQISLGSWRAGAQSC